MAEGAIVDVDGVCADFIKGLEKALGYKFDDEELKHWDLIKLLPSDLRQETYRKLTHPGFWRSLEVIDGAKEGVQYLESLGLPIIWATSPWTSCESWEAARREWLNEHFQMDSKKGHSYRPGFDKAKIHGAFIIDDKPSNVRDWASAHPGKKAFIFDAPYNKSFTSATRFTWEKVRDLV
jgi:5'(3')-deoxyribonucleotidase